MTTTRSSNRLTADDERAIVKAMLAAVDADLEMELDAEATYRIGARAIGCTSADLRPVEQGWIMVKASEALMDELCSGCYCRLDLPSPDAWHSHS